MRETTFFYKNGEFEKGEKTNLLSEDCVLPMMVLNKKAIHQNCDWMQAYADKAGVKLAPHGKTTMTPDLFKVQLSKGAWGMTLANAFQVKVAHAHGVNRILMANQLVGRQNIKEIVEIMKRNAEFEFYCCVDSPENVVAIKKICEELQLDRPFRVLIEIGPRAGRAGVRTSQEVIELAQCIQLNEPWVKCAGVECYEGVIHGKNAVAEVREFLNFVSEVCVELEQENLFCQNHLILTGGGTVFFDLVSDILTQTPLKKKFDVLIRPGCYLSHDSGIYDDYQNELLKRSEQARAIPGGLTSAIEVIAYVQSIPEQGVAILNIGKRDVSFDSGLPKPEKWFSVSQKSLVDLDETWCLSDLNDQHAFMSYPEKNGPVVGDIVILSVSHPCLTFDKWQSISMVDEDYNVVDNLKTFFG